MHFVRTPTLITIAVFIISSSLRGRLAEAKPNGCKYWCREGKRYYCCPDGQKESEVMSWLMQEIGSFTNYFLYIFNPWPILFKREMSNEWAPDEYNYPPGHYHDKEGYCPEVRPHCPRQHHFDQPPIACDSDEECSYLQKCCFDICLEHKTCKPAIVPM